MHIVLTVLMWILPVLAALMIIVLFTPVGVSVAVNYDKPVIWLRVLFFKFKIYPPKTEKKKRGEKYDAKGQTDDHEAENKSGEPPKPDENAQSGAQPEQQSAEQTANEPKAPNRGAKKGFPKLDINFEKLLGILSASSKAIKIVFKGIFITKIEIVYPVHKPDSAENAIAYGQTQAYFGGIAAALQNFFHLSFKRVQIIPDFANEHKYKRYFYCNIWATAFIMLVAAVYFLIVLKREKLI